MTHSRPVLVVDTGADLAATATRLLSADRVVAAKSIEEAADIVAGGRVDIALLGPSFAQASAVKSASLLRDADPGLTSVLVTDVVTNRILLAALRAGLNDVVDAPLTETKLDEIIERVPAERSTDGPMVLERAAEQIAAGPSSSVSTPVTFLVTEIHINGAGSADHEAPTPGAWSAPAAGFDFDDLRDVEPPAA
jgi:DNA-binding NtrC family response regulator